MQYIRLRPVQMIEQMYSVAQDRQATYSQKNSKYLMAYIVGKVMTNHVWQRQHKRLVVHHILFYNLWTCTFVLVNHYATWVCAHAHMHVCEYLTMVFWKGFPIWLYDSLSMWSWSHLNIYASDQLNMFFLTSYHCNIWSSDHMIVSTYDYLTICACNHVIIKHTNHQFIQWSNIYM